VALVPVAPEVEEEMASQMGTMEMEIFSLDKVLELLGNVILVFNLYPQGKLLCHKAHRLVRLYLPEVLLCPQSDPDIVQGVPSLYTFYLKEVPLLV
jgi:hypothetical protein